MVATQYPAPSGSPPAPQTGAAAAYASPPPQQPAHLEQQQVNPDLVAVEDEYVRDPHKLIAYIVPFPVPLEEPEGVEIPPQRFLIYTPPPPPLLKPVEGEKETTSHKIQRKWQEEVREAQQSTAKVASWKGIKSRITKGMVWAADKTTSAQLDFLTRVPKDGSEIISHSRHNSEEKGHDIHADDGVHEEDTTKATVQLKEMVMIYPPSLNMSPDQIKKEFVNTILRTQKKATKDAVIATGLLPVSAALDWALIFVAWPFGGALEVDAVWAASSIRGAKVARSLTKRLNSSATGGNAESGEGTLKLSFVPSKRAEPLRSYLLAKCMAHDGARFVPPRQHPSIPTEGEVIRAIGWQPSDQYESHNWEDEKWEVEQVESDLAHTMQKAAQNYGKWLDLWERNSVKAASK